MVDRIPYISAIKGLRKENFHGVEDKSTYTCVICMIDFAEEDEVAEIKCDKRHYFHTKCV